VVAMVAGGANGVPGWAERAGRVLCYLTVAETEAQWRADAALPHRSVSTRPKHDGLTHNDGSADGPSVKGGTDQRQHPFVPHVWHVGQSAMTLQQALP
jgi:hypothetical protein